MHRNVAIPDYRSLVTQTPGMDICQIETVSPEGTFCDTVQVPSSAGNIELN